MKGSSILKKINARVKQLKKKHPGAKRSTLQKQAGREFKAGKLKKKKSTIGAVRPKKKRVAKKRVTKRRVARKKAKSVRRIVRVVTKTKIRYRTRPKKKAAKRRKVSGKGKSLMPLLAVAALGVGAFMLLKPKTPQMVYVPTGNATRDNTAQSIISIASAAGATAAQIANIIKTMNGASSSQLAAMQAATIAAPDPYGALVSQGLLPNSAPSTNI